MAKTIEHEGVVERVEGQRVEVRIMQTSACSSCAAASLCHSSESKEKTIEALLNGNQQVAIGQRVRVVGQLSLGLKATVLAYVIPLIILVATLAIAQSMGASDGIGALLALMTLAVCYGVLWLMKDKLQHEFAFRIEEMNNN